MAHLFKLDVWSPRDAPAAKPEILRIVQVLRAIAAEHGRAMHAAGEAELPRQHLAKLRARYCSDNPDGVRSHSGRDE